MTLLLYRFGAVPEWMAWVGLTIDLVLVLTIILAVIAAERGEWPWKGVGPGGKAATLVLGLDARLVLERSS